MTTPDLERLATELRCYGKDFKLPALVRLVCKEAADALSSARAAGRAQAIEDCWQLVKRFSDDAIEAGEYDGLLDPIRALASQPSPELRKATQGE